MANKTNYLEGALLSHIYRHSAYTSPTTVYMALFTAAPDDTYTSGSPNGMEVSGNAYARQAITFGSPSGNPQQIANTSAVTFPAATPSGWGTLTHFGIFDASTGGNLLAWNPLTASKTIAAGDNPNFPIGAITVSEN